MSTVILTGFEPFDGASTNASWEAVSRVTGIPHLVTARLPVEFGAAWTQLEALIAEHSPDLVIAVGLAADRTAITPERVAINYADARIPDNAGAQPRESSITDGAAAHFTGVPVTSIVTALRDAGIPAEPSLSAGAFVCNELMYRMLDALDGTSVRAGFIHVPAETTIDAATLARGLEIAVEVSLR